MKFPHLERRPELDGLRGLFLVWMTLTHLPTHFSDLVNSPLGFVSPAEGFVFVSAFLVGRLYIREQFENETGVRTKPWWPWRARRCCSTVRRFWTFCRCTSSLVRDVDQDEGAPPEQLHGIAAGLLLTGAFTALFLVARQEVRMRQAQRAARAQKPGEPASALARPSR